MPDLSPDVIIALAMYGALVALANLWVAWERTARADTGEQA